ncbi:hypothetical protein [Pontimicrobium sp. IMCC45349]
MNGIKKFIKGLTGISLLFIALLFLAGIVGIISVIWNMIKFINQ